MKWEDIQRELQTIRDVPLYINSYKFPEIIDCIEEKLRILNKK